MAEDSQDLVCRFLPDMTISYANNACFAYFRRENAELIGHDFLPFFVPEDRKRLRRHLATLSPAKPVIMAKYCIQSPDSTLRWIQWSCRAIYNEVGVLTEVEAVGRDITDQMRAVYDSIRTENAIRQIFNMVPACIWKYCPATDQFCHVSDFISELSGLSRDELLLNASSWPERFDTGHESQKALQTARESHKKGESLSNRLSFSHAQPGEAVVSIHRPPLIREWGTLFLRQYDRHH